MSDVPTTPPSAASPRSGPPSAEIFRPSAPEARSPALLWAVGGFLVLVLVGVFLLLGGRRHHGPAAGSALPPDPYAASLPINGTAMSESVSLSGGKSTFIDGHIQNQGNQTVTGVTVQVFFRNEEGMPPQIDTVPLALVRTREPYVDTQQVSANPIRPGDDREFRLIFESIPGNWNVQLPEVRVVRVTAK